MAAADRHLPAPDHYQVLGVAREATSHDITRAWRRRARDEHPDHRPPGAGTAAADRFRVLAEAYHVLSDPGRRAAYDRALGTVVVPRVQPARDQPPPLRAGPVRIDRWPAASRRDERHAWRAVMALEFLDPDALAGDWGRLW